MNINPQEQINKTDVQNFHSQIEYIFCSKNYCNKQTEICCGDATDFYIFNLNDCNFENEDFKNDGYKDNLKKWIAFFNFINEKINSSIQSGKYNCTIENIPSDWKEKNILYALHRILTNKKFKVEFAKNSYYWKITISWLQSTEQLVFSKEELAYYSKLF